MNTTSQPEETRQQQDAIFEICRKHGGALCRVSPVKPTRSVEVDVYPAGTSIDDGDVAGETPAAPDRPAVARYRVMPSGFTIDISPGRSGVRVEGGQL